MVGLGNVNNTSDAAKPISTAQAAINATLAPLASPTFTGTISGITGAMVGLANVNNTTDLLKPISTATQAALDLKANQATTYTKVETDTRIQAVVGAAPAALDTLVEIAAQLASDESSVNVLVTTVSGKVDKITGKGLSTEDYTTAEKTKLGAISGTNTGDETLATIKTKLGITTLSGSNTGDQVIPTTLPASDVSAWAKAATKPTYTATEVGLGNVNNTTDAAKPVSTAQAAAIAVETSRATAAEALKAPLASPTFTGTVSGITKAMVGLGSVDNTTDAAKPISTATQAALDLKANSAALGTMSAQSASAVAITGGTINNVVFNGGTY